MVKIKSRPGGCHSGTSRAKLPASWPARWQARVRFRFFRSVVLPGAGRRAGEAPLSPATILPRGPGRRLFGGRLRGRTLLLVVFLCYVLVLVGRLQWQTYHLRRDIALAVEKKEALVRRQQLLQAELRRLNEPAYLERVAREELGMVRPGDVLVIPDDRLNSP